jgi:hypothetical protein
MIARALLGVLIFASLLIIICLIDYAYRSWCAWSEDQAALKRDLKVAQDTVAQLRLQLALAKVAMNMRDMALSVRKRSRGMYVVQK